MNRRAICNKVFVFFIILILVAANLVMLYLIFTKDKKFIVCLTRWREFFLPSEYTPNETEVHHLQRE